MPPFAALLPPRYRMERVLSAGERSTTVQAFDTGLRQSQAVLKVERLPDGMPEAAFRRFCGTLAALQSDWLAVPYTFGTLHPESGGILGYTARAFVNGTPLSAFALPVTTDVALLLTLQVCQGLDALHAKGLFHCDLKPENVIVRHASGGRIDERSRCVLIDIAYRPEATADALTEVTLQYVAPEMLDGKPADRRTDLYAVGVMAYRLLTGRLPFDGGPLPEMIRRQRAREFPRLAALRPDVPPGLCECVERLLEPNPDNRPEGVQVLATLLHEHAGPVPAGRRQVARSHRFVGREPELAACAAALDLDRPSAGVSSIEISGRPGCGVTAFLRELQDRLEARGMTVLTAAPRAAAGTTLQFQLHEAVHALARRPLIPSDEPQRLRAAKTSTDLLDDLLVATQDRRLVLFVDDWHLGDVGEILFLQRLILQDRAASEAMPGRSGRCQVVLGNTSEDADGDAPAVEKDIAKRIRLEGLPREAVVELLAGDDAFPRAFASRLHSATAGLPQAIRSFLDRVPSDRASSPDELHALLDAVLDDKSDTRAHQIEALRGAPGGDALLALALWGDELDLIRWQAIVNTLGVPRTVELPVDRVDRPGGPVVRSRHRHLCEFVAKHLPESDIARIAHVVLEAARRSWRSTDPAELIPLLRFVGRLGSLPPRSTWPICRALIVLLERGCFADIESVVAALVRCKGAPWWVGIFREAARVGTSALREVTPRHVLTVPTDAPAFFRAWIQARRLSRARYRSEALGILDTLSASRLAFVPAVALALAEDRALAAAEAGDVAVLKAVMRWMFRRVRRSAPLVRRGGIKGPGATIRPRLRACRQLARYQRVRGRAHLVNGRIDRALVACRKERLLDRVHGNTLREASCLNNEGILLVRAGAGPASVAVLERSVRIRERLDDESGLGIALVNLAAALSSIGNIGDAASVLNRARMVAARNGLDRLRNVSLLNLAIAYNRSGQLRDAHRVLRQARRTTRGDGDAEACARAFFNSGWLAADVWNVLAAERCAYELDRIHLASGTRESDASGDVVRAELAYRSRDWAHLHTLIGRMHGRNIDRVLTAAYQARVAVEAGDSLARDSTIERHCGVDARLRLALMRRRGREIRLRSVQRIIHLARRHGCVREPIEWIIAHLSRPEGRCDASLDMGLKVLSWFEFREGHDDLQIELRARLAGMLRERGRQAEAWSLIEDSLLRFRRLERRLRRWPRGAHVLLHLQERIQLAIKGTVTSSPGAGLELSAALRVQAFDLLMENRKRAIGGDTRHTDALVRLGAALARGGGQDALIDEVLSVALGLTGAQRAVLITGTSRSHDIRRTRLANGGPPANAQPDMSWAIVSQVLASGKSSLYSDALTSEELASHRSIATFKLRSLACVPLCAGGDVLGVLYLDHHGIAGLITSDMLGFLELLASLIAITIRTGQADERAAKARAELAETHRHLMRAERNRVAGELAGGLVHDLKNVLAAVSGRAQLLRRVNEDPHVLRALDAIEKAAGTGVGLLQRLQECSRDHSSQMEEAVDLVAAALEALELLAPRLEKGRVQVDVKALAGALAWGTPGEYREMFLNLIVNACDAMPEGGTLTVGFNRNAETRQIEIAVRDTGVGMSDETRARIFDPFFTTKGNHGTGLGLVVVKSVVVRRGGSVMVESSPGVGTCFRIAVPALGDSGSANEKGRLEIKRPAEKEIL